MRMDKDQDDWNKSLKVDNAIRNSSKKGANNPIFLHRSCKPLGSIIFDQFDDFENGICTSNCNF